MAIEFKLTDSAYVESFREFAKAEVLDGIRGEILYVAAKASKSRTHCGIFRAIESKGS